MELHQARQLTLSLHSHVDYKKLADDDVDECCMSMPPRATAQSIRTRFPLKLRICCQSTALASHGMKVSKPQPNVKNILKACVNVASAISNEAQEMSHEAFQVH